MMTETDTTAPTRLPAEANEAAEIADSMITLIRLYHSIKSRLVNPAEADPSPLFPLIRLVKGGPTRAKELAEQLCADPSTMSRQVASLVKHGLVEREADPDDGRASILVPTDSGITWVHQHYVNRGEAIEPIISDWSAEDRATFLRLLRRYTLTLEDRREDVIATMTSNHTLHQRLHDVPPQARSERSN